MRPHIPIALGAGLISAVVFASAATGPVVARMALLALVTLPIALSGYAYNARTAVLAASFGAFALGLATTLAAGAVYAVVFAFPAAFLVYLALLHRETGSAGAEWYPVGRIVFAAALLGGGIIATGFALGGADTDKLRAAVRSSLETTMNSGFGNLPGGVPLGEPAMTQLTQTALQMLPGISATFWMACILMCQWLAARVALRGGQLTRPWPDLAAFQLPLGTPLLLGLAIAVALLDDGAGHFMALAFAGVLYTVYALLGIAIIHHITRGLSWRGSALAGLYVLLLVLNTGASVMLALLGLADSFYPLRRQTTGAKPHDPNSPKP